MDRGIGKALPGLYPLWRRCSRCFPSSWPCSPCFPSGPRSPLWSSLGFSSGRPSASQPASRSLRGARHAPTLVWILNTLAVLSAVAALNSGLLRGVGILIDILLFVPLVWFAIWYQAGPRVR
jgi:hypothetical protein